MCTVIDISIRMFMCGCFRVCVRVDRAYISVVIYIYIYIYVYIYMYPNLNLFGVFHPSLQLHRKLGNAEKEYARLMEQFGEPVSLP